MLKISTKRVFTSWNKWLIISCIILLVALIISYRYKDPISIVDAHVINMDKSTERLAQIQSAAKKAGISLTRWPATDGSTINYDTIRGLNISWTIYTYAKENNKPGIIGCFLSHKLLLKHLETQTANRSSAHLILEDDAIIPVDFLQQWNEFSKNVPSDWDIIQIGTTHPKLKSFDGGRVHIHSDDSGNVGAFAYLVKHGSLRKVNSHLEYMYDPIDVMIRNKQDDWKIYYAWPEICPHNPANESTIVSVSY